MTGQTKQTHKRNTDLVQGLIAIVLLATLFVGYLAQGYGAVNAANSMDESASERVELRTRNTKVFQYSDGSGYAVVYMRPIHFLAQDGGWQEYDNRLLLDETRSLWRNQAGDFQLSFGKELASFRQSDTRRVFGLHNEAPFPVNVTTRNVGIGFQPLDGAAVEAQVDRTTAVYPGIYPGVDLRYTVDNDLLKEDLIFHYPPTQTRFSFLIYAGGKSLTLQESGLVNVACAEECLSIMPPYMQDASGEGSEDIRVELEHLQGGYYILTYTPARTWLYSPEREFPVVLDPTVTATSGYSTYVQEGFPTVSRCNANTFVAVGYDPGNVGQKRTRGYFHLSLPSLPAGSTITSATFRAYQYYYQYSNGYTADIYRVTSDWANPQTCGQGIGVWTWNNPPGIDWGTVYGSSQIPRGKVWGEWTITNLVRQWYSGVANRGLALVASPETARGSYFCSSIAYADGHCGVSDPQNYRPHAVINYTVNDTTPPNGSLTSPVEGARIGPGQVSLSATASDNPGGAGVKSVKFKVLYNGQWRDIATDTTAPYGVTWTTPSGLRSQQIRFAIDVTDNAGNTTFNAGGQRTVNFVESQNNPGVVENWVPSSKRAYLNQRSLTPYGDSKCGSAGAAMMLAMNGLIGKDYNSLRDTANAIYPKTIKDGQIWLYLITAQMRARGLNARESNQTADDGWKTIKAEIDAGRPVMVLSRKVTAGHFFVIVGYREQGTSRKIIVYDPYGQWLGASQSYNRNTTEANSAKGRWVTYDYAASWGGGWIVTAKPNAQSVSMLGFNSALDGNNPDPISEEPLEEVVYEGVLINERQLVFLPLIVRQN